MKTYVLSHSSCYDGLGAAWAAWRALGGTAEYYFVSYGKPVPYMEPGSIVYVLDFCYDLPTMEELARVHKAVIVRDHHKTAAERFMPGFNTRMLTHLDGNLDVHFDMNKSGALMAWEYFRPNLPVPQIIQAVSDRDLWNFKLVGTKEIHAVLVSRPMTIESFEKSFEDVEFTKAEVVKEGESLLRLQEQIVQNIIKNSWIEVYHGHTVAMVNASSHWSEVGHALLDKYGETIDFAISYVDLPGGTRMYSLRSTGFDVAKFSEQFKGGGHKTAAGYKLSSPGVP